MENYTREFFKRRAAGSLASAREILPLVLDLVQPASAIDVGCGTGAWLTVLGELGITDYLGVDGAYAPADDLTIPIERFRALNLTTPFRVERSFDLVISLEVAEHLPGDCAAGFVSSLCALGPVVLFSAAIPWQGGTGHVNEHWPEYWAQLFARSSFVAVDAIRHRIWNNPRVEWWYAQNTLLFVEESRLGSDARLRLAHEQTRATALSRIHPRCWVALNLRSEARVQLPAITAELTRLIPEGDAFILVDDDVLGSNPVPGRRAIPFLEREGQYWGAPADSSCAIAEMERLRAGGAAYIVFYSSAFWWLDHYADFAAHLRTYFTPLLENTKVVVFRLVASLPCR